MKDYKITGQISPAAGWHEADAGHLFVLLHKAITRAMDTFFPSGQGGPGPTEDEEIDMEVAQKETEKIAKEIFLGLTGKHVLTYGEKK